MAKGDSCEVCGKSEGKVFDSKVFGMKLCQKHYSQKQTHGKTLSRTSADPNEIVIYKDYAEVIMYNKKCEESARAKIDLEDIDKVKKYKWNLGSDKYAVSKTDDQRRVAMHRYLMDCPDDMVTDHKFGDRLDNRKEHLRNCTFNENLLNQKRGSRNTSGCKGVSWEQNKRHKNGVWLARITVKGKYYFLGYFKNFDDAVRARKAAETKYQGEFAYKEVI